VGLYSAQKLEGERLKCFALSISMQTKAIGGSLQSPGLKNIPKLRQIEPKLLKITMRVRPFRLFWQS